MNGKGNPPAAASHGGNSMLLHFALTLVPKKLDAAIKLRAESPIPNQRVPNDINLPIEIRAPRKTMIFATSAGLRGRFRHIAAI